MREVLDVSSIRRGRQGRRSRRFVQHARLMHGQWVVLSKLGAGRGWEVEVSSPGAAPVLMYPGSLPRAAWAAWRRTRQMKPGAPCPTAGRGRRSW
mgnify:CR=1 FL=1